MTLPLALRRQYPLPVALTVFGATALEELLTTAPEGLSTLIALLVAAYSLGAYAEAMRATVGVAYVLVLSLTFGGSASDAAFVLVLIGAAWGAGRIVRHQRLLLAALARAQAARERAAVADERARLARELHHVVAHSVSTMVVQAEAGESLFEDDPEAAREAFASISASGRQALGELRRMLGLLRVHDGETPLEPQPGLRELESLVEQMRLVGLPVELSIEGEPLELPAGIDLSAFRIVQEALTNTLKHAGPAHALVTVRYGVDHLELQVADDGRGGDTRNDAGHGIAGMRERVRLFGGTLEARGGDAGGFVVHARLPVGAA